jgi:hypothetical protein
VNFSAVETIMPDDLDIQYFLLPAGKRSYLI